MVCSVDKHEGRKKCSEKEKKGVSFFSFKSLFQPFCLSFHLINNFKTNKNECELIPRSRECNSMPSIGQARPDKGQANLAFPSFRPRTVVNVKSIILPG